MPARSPWASPRIVKSGPGGKAKYVPMLYDGGKLRMVTPISFCWGIQKDRLNTTRVSYKLPLVMVGRGGTPTNEHVLFVKMFRAILERLQTLALDAKLGKKANIGKLGGCLYYKEGGGDPTLYAKIGYNEEKKKFYARFQKAKVRKGCTDKRIDPLAVENDRCLARAVVCLDSIYVSASHTTLQAKVTEASLDFDGVVEESFLPEPEEESGDEDEWKD